MPNSRLTKIVDFKNFVVLLQNLVIFWSKFWFDVENGEFSEFKIFDSLQFRGFKNFRKQNFQSYQKLEFHGGKNLGSRFPDPFSYQSLFINLSNHTANVAPFISSISKIQNFRKSKFLKSDNSKVKSVKIEMKCSQIFWGYIYGAPTLF